MANGNYPGPAPSGRKTRICGCAASFTTRVLLLVSLVIVINVIACDDVAQEPGPTKSGDLGVSRSEMLEIFDDITWDPAFETPDGEPGLSGGSADGKETVFLIGPEKGLTQIGYITWIDIDSTNNQLHQVRRYFLLALVLPDWDGAADWVIDNTPYGHGDKPAATVVDGTTVDMRRSQDPPGHMILSIRK